MKISYLMLVLMAISLILVLGCSKPQQKGELTEKDFNILSASWDTYSMEWRGVEDAYVADTTLPIDWNALCESCKSGKRSCEYGSYHLVIEASGVLHYNVAIDGINTENLRKYPGVVQMGSVKEGVQNVPISLSDGMKTNPQIYSNFDIRKSHEIILCATTPQPMTVGATGLTEDQLSKLTFICDSVTLPAKCN